MITGLAASLHRSIMYFCAKYTFSDGISIPIEDLETMIPSETSKIYSKFVSPSLFSILAMILICSPFGPNKSLMYSMSAALRTNEAAMRSIPRLIPKSQMSFSSCSVKEGRSNVHPGRLILYLSSTVKSFRHSTLM